MELVESPVVPENKIWLRRFRIHFGVAASLAVLADFLFYEEPPGWSLAIFGIALVAIVFWNRRPSRASSLCPGIATALAVLCMSFILGSGFLAVVMFTGGIAVLAILARHGWTDSFVEWAKRFVRFGIEGATQAPRDFWDLDRRAKEKWSAWTILRKTGAWLGPAMLSMGFLALFILANPLIEQTWNRAYAELPAWITRLCEIIEVPRILFWVWIFTVAWALMRVRLENPPPGAPCFSEDKKWPELSRGFVVRCLPLFNAVFLIETGLDAIYLWGGAKLPGTMTYAEYAHRGAYPLIATALLAGAFVLATFRPGSESSHGPWTRRLVFLWLGQNIFLTIASIWRLHLYVEAYSLTRLRVAAAIWMGLVGIGLGLIVWRIHTNRDNVWLLRANLIAVVSVLYLSSFADFNAAIANYNVAHCREMRQEGPPIDLHYLSELGAAALPAMKRVEPALATREQREEAIKQRTEIENRFRERFSNWRFWSLRRQWIAREMNIHANG